MFIGQINEEPLLRVRSIRTWKKEFCRVDTKGLVGIDVFSGMHILPNLYHLSESAKYITVLWLSLVKPSQCCPHTIMHNILIIL